MICAQAGQLFLKAALHARFGFDQILRQLVGDIDLVPAPQATKRFSESGLTASVDIGGIKVVDTEAYRFPDLLGDGILVDASAFFGEAQTAIPQYG